MREPRESTFAIGQQVEISHSNTRYNKRTGKISAKVGGGIYTVQLEKRTRTVNGPTGHPRQVTDGTDKKNFKLGSLKLLPTLATLEAASTLSTGKQVTLFPV